MILFSTICTLFLFFKFKYLSHLVKKNGVWCITQTKTTTTYNKKQVVIHTVNVKYLMFVCEKYKKRDIYNSPVNFMLSYIETCPFLIFVTLCSLVYVQIWEIMIDFVFDEKFWKLPCYYFQKTICIRLWKLNRVRDVFLCDKLWVRVGIFD